MITFPANSTHLPEDSLLQCFNRTQPSVSGTKQAPPATAIGPRWSTVKSQESRELQ